MSGTLHSSCLAALTWALMSLGCRASEPPLVDEVLDDFRMKSGENFLVCGSGAVDCGASCEPSREFQEASQCLLDAWSRCDSVEAALHWYYTLDGIDRHLFILPGEDEGCRLVDFEQRYRTGFQELKQMECAVLAPVGSEGVIEPQMCILVDTREVSVLTKE